MKLGYWLVTAAILSLAAEAGVTTRSAARLAGEAGRHRKLVDGYQFRNENFFDSRTASMRDFLEGLQANSAGASSAAQLRTGLEPDNTFTTGNLETIDNVNKLMPAYDTPSINEDVYKAARDYQLELQSWLDVFNLNIFSEDPNTFLGDKTSYYLIIKKRGMVFYYLSRAILYGLIIYLMVHFIFRDFQKTKLDLNEEDIPRRAKVVAAVQLGVFIVLTVSAAGLLLSMDRPRGLISKVFSDLYFTFKQIDIKAGQVVNRNRELNQMKLFVPGDGKRRFVVQDRMTEALQGTKEDLVKIGNFLNSSKQLRLVSENVPSIAISIFGVVLIGLYSAGRKSKSASIQLSMMIVCGVAAAYLLNSIDKFVAGFSGMNDLCISLLRYARNPVLPHQGYGVANQIGCSVEQPAFQQLFVNTVAQNSALAIFNAELVALGREPVKSPDQAIKTTAYLRSLDSSNDVFESYSLVLQKNADTIKDLLSLNGCNLVREWLDGAQKDLCLTASHQVSSIFFAYLWLCLLLVVGGVLATSLMWLFTQLNKRKRATNFLLHTDHFENRFVNE